MQLSVQSQNFPSRLSNLQEHPLLILAHLNVLHARTLHLLARAILSFEQGWHAQALSIKHDYTLPVVELKELEREADARLTLRGCGRLPFPEPAIDIQAPRAEIVEF